MVRPLSMDLRERAVARCGPYSLLAFRTMGPGLRLPVGVFGMTFSPCLRRRPDQLSLRHTSHRRGISRSLNLMAHILSAEFANEVAKVKNNVTGAGQTRNNVTGAGQTRRTADQMYSQRVNCRPIHVTA
jgi:hypothetical protein